MLRFSIVILHALTVLAQGSIPEYFYKDEGDERSDMETMFKYDGVENPKQSGTPVAYLYVVRDSTPPAKNQCITCLYELYNTGVGLADACNCLPCWMETSKNDATQKVVIELFKRRSCSAVRYRNRASTSKEVDNEETHTLLRKQQRRKPKTESGKNVKNVKYIEDYLHYPDESEQPAKRKKNRGESISLKSSLTSDDSSVCVGEDCEDEEAIKAVHDESYKVVKEKVKKVFNDVLSKMARINKAAEETEESETSEDTSGTYRREKNQRSEERPKWQASKSYDNQYRRPSFRVALAPTRDNSNHRKSEKKDDIISDEDDMEIMAKGARHEEMTESKIPKSSMSKDRKSKIGKEARSDDVPEAIPDDISIGSLTFKDPFEDEEEIDYDDQLGEDGFTSAKDLTKDTSEGDVRDYTIHYDDNVSEEKNQKNDKETTEVYDETRNTPSDEDQSKTTETPYRSGKRTPSGVRKSKSGLRLSKFVTTTEEPPSKVSSEESESVTSSGEDGYSTQKNSRRNAGKGEEVLATTETSRSEQTEMTSDNSTVETTPRSEESTTASSKSLIMRFTDVSRSTERSPTSEESTESTITSESPSTVQTPYDSSSESVTSKTPSSESSEVTFKFRSTRKYTRSISETATTNKQRRNDDSRETKTTEVTESTKSERLLRQTDSNDFKLERNEKSKTTESVDVPKRRIGDFNMNATQDKNPRYVIELEDESDSSGKTWNPDEPILKVKVNIFSDTEPVNVYNFLKKIIPKDKNSEDDRESKKGLQIETSFQNDRPKTLSVRNIEKPNRRGY